MAVNTPNMNLIQPTQGVDSGIVWEQSVNSNTGILDGHTHAAGSGVQIQPSGLNISSDLTFNIHNAINLRSSRYTPQVSPISLGTDLGCVYVAGVDLYYNDINGNQIRITSGGTVNATSSGISNGTATASFSGGVLIVDENTNAPGNIQAASYLMGQTGVAGSNFLTLSPPSSLSSGSYGIVFPALPTTKGILTLDSSGNMATGPTPLPGSQSFVMIDSSGNLAASTSATNGILRSNIVAMGFGQSASSGTFSTTSGSVTPVTNLSASLTTTGGTVLVSFGPDGSTSNNAFIGVATSAPSINAFAGAIFILYRDSTIISRQQFTSGWTTSSSPTAEMSLDVPPAFLNFIDLGASSGSHTYTLSCFVQAGTSTQIYVYYVALTVKELL